MVLLELLVFEYYFSVRVWPVQESLHLEGDTKIVQFTSIDNLFLPWFFENHVKKWIIEIKRLSWCRASYEKIRFSSLLFDILVVVLWQYREEVAFTRNHGAAQRRGEPWRVLGRMVALYNVQAPTWSIVSNGKIWWLRKTMEGLYQRFGR